MASSCCYEPNFDSTTTTDILEEIPVYSLNSVLSVKEPRLTPRKKLFCTGTKLTNKQEIIKNIELDGSVQLFTGGPTSYYPKKLDFDIVKSLKKSTKETSLLIHCPFTLDISKRSADTQHLIRYLSSEKGIRKQCILHIGKGENVNLLTQNISNIPKNLLPIGESKLCLEVSAAGTIGTKFKHLRHISEKLDEPGRIGLCLDTQHMYASGMCSFTNEEDTVKRFDYLRNYLNVGSIHLNDSCCKFKECKDRHATLGTGHIWGKNKSSLKDLVEYCLDYNIPLISETKDPQNDREVLDKLFVDSSVDLSVD